MNAMKKTTLICIVVFGLSFLFAMFIYEQPDYKRPDSIIKPQNITVPQIEIVFVMLDGTTINITDKEILEYIGIIPQLN